MNDLIDAEQEFIELLKENKWIYSKGNFATEITLIKEYGVSKDVIIQAHNEGQILDVYASCFTHRLPDLTTREIRFGDTILPKGYAFVDLDDLPQAVLYGQLKPSFEKRDVLGEHIRELQERKRSFYPLMSDKDKLLEKARLQKDEFSPKTRIGNARAVIEGADLDGSSESNYKKQIKDLEEGAPIANKILHDIANGRWMLTNAVNSALSKEDFKKLFAIYSGPDDLGLQFSKIDAISEKLDHIENCREILERYNLDDKYINAILGVNLGDISQAWIEKR